MINVIDWVLKIASGIKKIIINLPSYIGNYFYNFMHNAYVFLGTVCLIVGVVLMIVSVIKAPLDEGDLIDWDDGWNMGTVSILFISSGITLFIFYGIGGYQAVADFLMRVTNT